MPDIEPVTLQDAAGKIESLMWGGDSSDPEKSSAETSEVEGKEEEVGSEESANSWICSIRAAPVLSFRMILR